MSDNYLQRAQRITGPHAELCMNIRRSAPFVYGIMMVLTNGTVQLRGEFKRMIDTWTGTDPAVVAKSIWDFTTTQLQISELPPPLPGSTHPPPPRTMPKIPDTLAELHVPGMFESPM